jgi:pentatricopeptide repeat protein
VFCCTEPLRTGAAAPVKPNADTYVQLMTACSKGGQTPAAVALMDEMQVKGIVPTAASAAAVMLALGNTRTRESATEGAQHICVHTMNSLVLVAQLLLQQYC